MRPCTKVLLLPYGVALIAPTVGKNVPKAFATLMGQALLNRSFTPVNSLFPCILPRLKHLLLVSGSKIFSRAKASF
ncbi:MAG: hypothetical protein COB22_01390 [Cycloclasticus sp.]|nr:MAG: hypothetical protein COB22_01390 [Cycloclasticus sp.]